MGPAVAYVLAKVADEGQGGLGLTEGDGWQVAFVDL
jgi:hypothetical protein